MTSPSPRNLAVLCLAGCAVLVVLLLLEFAVAAATAKIVASTAFVMVAIRAGATKSGFGRLLLLGLLFSWFGDAFLIGTSQTAFLAGLGAFLLAHLAYMAAFVVTGLNAKWIMTAVLPVVSCGLAVSVWLTPYLTSELVLPVRCYTAVISLMVLAAFGARGSGAPTLALVGAVLFFLSDVSVAALRLAGTDSPTYVWGLPLYYGGQLCLALSASAASVRTRRAGS